MVAAGDDPSAITEVTRTEMIEQFAALANVPAPFVRLDIVAASLLLTFEITSPVAEEVAQAITAVSSQLTTPESANAALPALSSAGTGVAIITAPTVSQATTRNVQAPDAPPSAPPPGLPPPAPPPSTLLSRLYNYVTGAGIGLGIGIGIVSILLLICLIVLCCCCCKKRSPKAYAAVQRRVSKLTESTVEISVPSMSFKGVGEESAHVAPPPPMGDAPTPPPPPNDEIQDEIESRLEKLKSLTMRNLITEEEYSAKKAEVLKDMKI